MNQTRFYVVENRNRTVQVSLLIGGLPPLLTKEEYVQLMQEHLAIKGESGLREPGRFMSAGFHPAKNIFKHVLHCSVSSFLAFMIVRPLFQKSNLLQIF